MFRTNFLRFYQDFLEKMPSADDQYKIEKLPTLIRMEGPGSTAFENSIVHCNLTDVRDLECVIDEQIAYFGNKQRSFEWKYSSLYQPKELESILLNKGFQAGEKEEILVLDLSAPLNVGDISCELAIKEIASDEQVSDLVNLQNEIWGGGLDWLKSSLQREKRNAPESLYIFGCYQQEKLVATGWVKLHHPLASLYGGATLPAVRGKGAFRALVRQRAILAKIHNCSYLMVEAAPMSSPILKALDFHYLGDTRPYIWQCS
ncbi:MAG: hypothetical protein ACOH5I_23365 [Oligoflexus sp.]